MEGKLFGINYSSAIFLRNNRMYLPLPRVINRSNIFRHKFVLKHMFFPRFERLPKRDLRTRGKYSLFGIVFAGVILYMYLARILLFLYLY